MTTYAASTDVAPDRSRAEIEKNLTRYGAQKFMYGWDEDRAIVAFEAHGKQVRFELPMPELDDPKFWRTETGRRREAPAARKEWEQAKRSSWRALALVIKSKLIAVQTGIVSFEQEFLAHFVLPDGSTVNDHVEPALERLYAGEAVDALLPRTFVKQIGSGR